MEGGWVSADEIAALEAADKAVAAVIEVDDFAHDGLAMHTGAQPSTRPIWTDGAPRPGLQYEEQRTFSGVEL